MRDPSQSPEPKSACTGDPSPIDAINAAESGATGSVSTRWFQTLVAGKTGHPPSIGDLGALPPRAAVAKASAAPAAARTLTVGEVAPPIRRRVA